jgi:hypothetical protein
VGYPSKGGDVGSVGREEVVVDTIFASWKELAWEHAEVRASVKEDNVFSGAVCVDYAAGTGISDVCRHLRLLVKFSCCARKDHGGVNFRALSRNFRLYQQ